MKMPTSDQGIPQPAPTVARRQAGRAEPVAAQTELAEERDLLRILLDNIPDSIYFKDTEGRFLRVNQAQMRMLGIDRPEAACGRTDFDFFDPGIAREAARDEREILESGKPLISKIERVTRPGLSRWVTATKVPIRGENGAIHGIVGVSRDITAWKEATEAVQKSEESLRLLFAAIPHAVWVYDAASLEFLEFNQTALERYGYSADEFRRLRIPAIHPPEEAARLRRLLASFDSAHPPDGVWKHQTKDGRILAVEIDAHALEFRGRQCVLAVVQDITERKRLELELQHSQRLEAVGQLAAGIAHEINTPVQYVGDNIRFLLDAFQQRQRVFQGYQQLRRAVREGNVTTGLLDELDRTVAAADLDYLAEEIPRALAQSLDGVDRVATIVRAMKEFAHPGHKEKAAADLNKALAGTLIVARNELKYVADVETDFGEVPPVICHLADINQVFLNLLINAADAIRETVKGTSARGRVTIRTRQSGNRAVISISDTGCGIPAAIQAKVFDPFFTTKQVGRGSGQGLAIARAIVDQHGGNITFRPNLPRGTTFTVSIPIESTAAGAGDVILPAAPENSHEEHSVRG